MNPKNTGQIIKVDHYNRHVVAIKSPPEELQDLNTIENLDEVWGSLRLNGLTKEETRKLPASDNKVFRYRSAKVVNEKVVGIEMKTKLEGFKIDFDEERHLRKTIN